MPALYRIKYLPDGPEMDVCGTRGNYYEFDDGSRLDVHTTLIWCRQCATIRDGERIESLEDIDRQIKDLNDPASELYRMTANSVLQELTGRGEEFRLEQIEKLKRRRRWREARTSPPKCISCGSTDLYVFPVNEVGPNPTAPGEVEVNIIGMCSTDFNNWFFTPEGDRIPRDTKPTYWHHPDLDNSPKALRDFLKRHGISTGQR